MAALNNREENISTVIAQENDQRAAQYFAIAMAGLIVLFSAFHWSQLIYEKYASKNMKGPKVIWMAVRSIQYYTIRWMWGFTSYGHLCVVLAYLCINIVLSVTSVDWSDLRGIAKRCGWMSLCNLALITFLAQKNTPLRLLTSYSYERLNKLHQIGGYTTITYTLLHLTLMCIRYSGVNELGIFLKRAQIYGIIAAIAMFIILITATVLRKIQYEAFYAFHIIMYGLVMVGVGMHRPSGSLKAAIITTVAGCIWALDHIVRGCRLIRNIHHSATVTPLPHGGTRVVLHPPPSRAMAGCHCFLWAPKIRLFQTHPFTIVSTAPQSLELVITAKDGFTKALHQYALLNPGAKLRASIDGPYGRPPTFLEAVDEVILIAGGSGASFTFGIALSMIRKLGGFKPTSIHFIWTVKKHETLFWFSKELSELQSSPFINLHLHTTSQCTNRTTAVQELLELPRPIARIDEEKRLSVNTAQQLIDIEKAQPLSNSRDSSLTLTTITGRPAVGNLIEEIVARAGSGTSVGVAACGPAALMKDVRTATASVIRVTGRSVRLHCENFGW